MKTVSDASLLLLFVLIQALCSDIQISIHLSIYLLGWDVPATEAGRYHSRLVCSGGTSNPESGGSNGQQLGSVGNLVDGRNSAPVDMVNILLFHRVSYLPGDAGFLPSTVLTI